MPVIEHSPSSFTRSLLTGLALILIGVLVGVVASQLVPASPSAPLPAVPTVEPSISITPSEEPPILTPTATPAALLNLKWTTMTVKSPIPAYASYRIYYPTTWSIKRYEIIPGIDQIASSILLLVKGPASLAIRQVNNPPASCDYSGKVEAAVEGVSVYESYTDLIKNGNLYWRWGKALGQEIPTYDTCEAKNTPNGFSSPTSIGFIELTGSNIDTQTLDEFNYILEKLVIL